MFISDLNALYSNSSAAIQTSELCKPAASKLHLRGLVGSGAALVAYSAMQKTGGVHLFVLPDKEEAAYMLNDLENAAGKIPGEESTTGKLPIDLYFFPAAQGKPMKLSKPIMPTWLCGQKFLMNFVKTLVRKSAAGQFALLPTLRLSLKK